MRVLTVGGGRLGSINKAALRISLIYAVIAALWVAFSDRATLLMPPEWSLRLQTVKGLLFVLVTSLVIYGLVRRWAEEARQELLHAESLERILGQVVETVPVGVLLLTAEGLITFLNPAAEQLLGTKTEEAVGRGLDELGLMDAATANVGILLSARAVDGVRLRDPQSGEERAVIARAAPIDDSLPGSGWVIAVVDATDAYDTRDRMARLLDGYQFLSDVTVVAARSADSSAMLREICDMALERGLHGAWSLIRRSERPDDFEDYFAGVGEAAKSIARLVMESYEPDGQIGSRLFEGEILVYNDVAHDPRNPWYSAAKEEGIGSVAILGIAGASGMRTWVTLFSQNPGHFSAELVTALKTFRGSVGFGLDRIELDRKRIEAEDALEASENAYRMLFETHPAPMYIFDAETLDFLAVNDAAVAEYGYSRDEFLRMKITGIRPDREVPALIEALKNRPEEPVVDFGTFTHKSKQGEEFPVRVQLHRIEWNNRKAELVIAFT